MPINCDQVLSKDHSQLFVVINSKHSSLSSYLEILLQQNAEHSLYVQPSNARSMAATTAVAHGQQCLDGADVWGGAGATLTTSYS